MRREMELALGERLLSKIQEGPTPAAKPFKPIDAKIYVDEANHREEVALIASNPVAALAASELAEAGDFVTLELAGTPLIVTRDQDGQVRAMHNVCAHRGSTVEPRNSGSARIFSCGFHGWSYNLDGSLRAVSAASLYSSEPCTSGLRQLPCEQRHGIIWVTPNQASTISVTDWLGPELDEMFSELGLAEMTHYATEEFNLNCNWKLLTDGFLEIYHLKYLHRNSIAPFFPAHLTLSDRYGRHFANWVPKNRLVTALTERPRDQWPVLDHVTGAFVLVPGTVVQWQAGHVELFSLRPHPTDPTRSTARLTMLVPTTRLTETDLWDRNWLRVCQTIPEEDFAAAVGVAHNINCGAVNQLRIGANEHQIVEHLAALQTQP
ncbi:MAG: aromatic ring-hydroxylating dioxygenase subunit alpha [Acidimicrobiia bacterium]|nr:aromatic ring-hydroxylating dioxygenase subunit alpha [Acidimicrobiia bacterium]MCY4458082.1 aromatic ring-hydroxylating dioxygenase subunit alpha [Acidimicrobiaceae bacterium]